MTEAVAPKHVMVVGATSGLGLEYTKRQLAAGSNVTALGRRVGQLQELAEPNLLALAFDVTQVDGIAEVIAQAVARFGKLDVVVFCAGLQMIKPMRAFKPQDIKSILDTNLTAALAFGQVMTSARNCNADAVFCAVSSISAARPEPGIVPYAVAKAGVEALIKGLAREIAPRRAVGVAPGWLDTGMTAAYPQIYTESFKQELEKRSPLGITSVQDVCQLIEFLTSPMSRSITGQIVTIDGGASL